MDVQYGCPNQRDPNVPMKRPHVLKMCRERMGVKRKIEEARKIRHRVLMDIHNLEKELEEQKRLAALAKLKKKEPKKPHARCQKPPPSPVQVPQNANPNPVQQAGAPQEIQRKKSKEKIDPRQLAYQATAMRADKKRHCNFDSEGFVALAPGAKGKRIMETSKKKQAL